MQIGLHISGVRAAASSSSSLEVLSKKKCAVVVGSRQNYLQMASRMFVNGNLQPLLPDNRFSAKCNKILDVEH